MRKKQQLQQPIMYRAVLVGRVVGIARWAESLRERLLSLVSDASCELATFRKSSGAWHACHIPTTT